MGEKHTMLIGLCGPKGSGKSTLAAQMEKIGYHRYPLADPIKHMESAILRMQGVPEEEIFRLAWIDKEEPTEYLNGETSRRFQQTIGTDWGRDIFESNIWIGIWERRVDWFDKISRKIEYIVIEDVRFPNEVDMIHYRGGKIGYINRLYYSPDDKHASESYSDTLHRDFIIYNDSTPESMFRQFESYITKMR